MRRRTYDNIEAGGETVPVVSYLRVTSGRNCVTAGNGANDLALLSALTGRRGFLGGSRQREPVGFRGLGKVRTAKRDRHHCTEQKWFLVHSTIFAIKTAQIEASSSAAGFTVASPRI